MRYVDAARNITLFRFHIVVRCLRNVESISQVAAKRREVKRNFALAVRVKFCTILHIEVRYRSTRYAVLRPENQIQLRILRENVRIRKRQRQLVVHQLRNIQDARQLTFQHQVKFRRCQRVNVLAQVRGEGCMIDLSASNGLFLFYIFSPFYGEQRHVCFFGAFRQRQRAIHIPVAQHRRVFRIIQPHFRAIRIERLRIHRHLRILARQVVTEPIAVICANDSRLKFALCVLPVQRIHVPPREIQHIRITRIHQLLNRLNFRIHQLLSLCKGRRCLRHNLRLNILGVRLIEEGLVVVVAVFHFRIIPERQAIRFSIEHEVSRLSEMLHKGRMREIPLPINLNHIHGIAVKIRNKD